MHRVAGCRYDGYPRIARTLWRHDNMAKKKSSKKGSAKSKTKVAARKPASKSKVKAKSVAQRPAPKKAHKRAAAGENVFQRLFDRARHIFKQPLDPRIKHLVEVFGVEAVVGLMEAYRQSRDDGHHDELRDAVTRAESAQSPPMHGSWAWHELMTRDVPGSKRFYRDMFGWESNDMEMMPGFNYTLFGKAGKDIGGMLAIRPEHGDMPSGWGVYVAVDDVDSAADKAEALGGEIVVPAHDIPVGRWAMIKDPAGAVICLYRAKSS